MTNFAHADETVRRVTQKDVAARLGLTQSGVSRGLRGDPGIAAETKRQIKAVCEELGYRPNQILSELAASRWQSGKVTQGSVIAYVDRFAKTYVGGTNLVPLLRQQAALLGYDVELFYRAEFSNSAKLQRALRNRGITDVILGPIFDRSSIVELDWSKFICVQLSPGLFPLPLHGVVQDCFNTVVLAWQKAVDHGYQRIGAVLFSHPVQIMDDVLRRSAVDACQNYLYSHLPRLGPLLYSTINDLQIDHFVRWVEITDPEVIIGFNSTHHVIFRSRFHREIPYISLHTDGRAGEAGILEAAPSCAREAVNLLHFCRRTYQWGIPKERIDHVVEPVWTEGNTLPYRGKPPNKER